MTESLSIRKEEGRPPAEDYAFLRRKGIEMIQDLCGKSWTDYNAHDPGITLLEAYCYALTELAYRVSFDMKDILATRRSEREDWTGIFYTPDRILPCNPVTIADYRKLVADIAGIRNVWMEKSDDYEVPIYLGQGREGYELTYEAGHGIVLLPLKGLYRVLVEFEEDVIREKREEEVLRHVREKLHRHRNLGEDFVSVASIEYEPFALEAEIKVREGFDIDLITARIYQAVRNLFSPAINFYTPDQLRERGYPIEQLFEGPVLNHGFIDTVELEDSAITEVQLSDIVGRITAIEGVIAIEKLSIPRDAGSPFPDFTEWLGHIRDRQKTPRLDTEASGISFVRNGDRHRTAAEKKADPARVKALLNYLLAGDQKVKLKTYEREWEPSAGEYMELEEYYPFQRSLPACYKMEEKYLTSGGELDDEKRQVLRLRGFLFLFEQVLANSLSQLAHVRELFSFDAAVQSTYFTQIPKEINDWQALFAHLPAYEKHAAELLESDMVRLKRRNELLDHLLGRLGEGMSEYEGAGLSSGKEGAEKAIRDKIAFLQDAVALSNYRGKAFDYTRPEGAWDTDNVAGCKKRVCRLLGMPGYQRTAIASDALSVGEVHHENGMVRFVVRLSDPADRQRLLLQSIEYESRREAEAALDFLLEQGGDRRLYEFDPRHEKSSYHLVRLTAEGEREIVASGHFHHREEMERHFERLMEVLLEFAGSENFHLVEHILLRPRIDARGGVGRVRHAVIDKERVALLPVPEEGQAVVADPGDLPEQPPYRFKMVQGAGPEREEWRLSLVNTEGEEIFFVQESFAFYKHLTRRIEHLRRLAAELDNYSIERVADGYFMFNLNDGGRRLAEGKKKYKEEARAKEEVDRLVRFFTYDRAASATRAAGEDFDNLAALDPYSFHVTVVLPSWPARFRDPGFRHLLEKTLFLEIPAHIYPRIYWVGHQSMRRFEEAYKLWLVEQTNEGIPNTEILNNFLFELGRLPSAAGDGSGSGDGGGGGSTRGGSAKNEAI
jgi:hypothetical protein